MHSGSCGHDGSLGILQGGCKSLFFVSAVSAALAKDFCPREKIFKAWKPNRLGHEIRLVSAQGPRRTYDRHDHIVAIAPLHFHVGILLVLRYFEQGLAQAALLHFWSPVAYS